MFVFAFSDTQTIPDWFRLMLAQVKIYIITLQGKFSYDYILEMANIMCRNVCWLCD